MQIYLLPILLTMLVGHFSTNSGGELFGQNNNSDAKVNPNYSSFIDTRDGKTYKTVLIGTQWWMAENLNYSTSGTFINGTLEQTNNGMIEKYCYNNDNSYCAIYGGLYQWAEMVQYINGATNSTSWSNIPQGNIQGVCPSGWHLPTDAEWCTMENMVEAGTDPGCMIAGWRGMNIGSKLKEAGTVFWLYPNSGATNTSGFTALPSGSRHIDGSFGPIGFNDSWTATEKNSTNAWNRGLWSTDTRMARGYNNKVYGFSVRCVKD